MTALLLLTSPRGTLSAVGGGSAAGLHPIHDRPPFSGRPSLTRHCGHGWTCARPAQSRLRPEGDLLVCGAISDEALHKTRFRCHVPAKDRDYDFAGYAT